MATIRSVMNIISLVMALLFITSCGYIGGNSRENANENYRSGSQGLVINFMPNMPPSRVYDNEKLTVAVEVRNRGATDIQSSSSRLYLAGFDNSLISGVSTAGNNIGTLEGKSMYNSEGGYTNVIFDGYIGSIGSRNIDEYNPTLQVTACYRYETIADPMVCIDMDPFSPTNQEKICNANTVQNLGGSQGAPVAVSSVQTEPSKGKMRFKIYVSNVGGGLVFKDGYNYLNRCNPYNAQGLEFNDIDMVRVEEVKVAGTSILPSCKPLENGYLRLKGAGYIICEYSGATGPAYTTPLTIKVSYGYRNSITKPIQIVKNP